MFCKYCGKEIAEDAKFCSICGKPISEPVLTEEALPIQMKESADGKRRCPHCNTRVPKGALICWRCGKSLNKEKKNHPILIVLLILFGFIIFICSFGGSEEPQKVNSNPPVANVESVNETTAPVLFTIGDTLEMNNILITLDDISESSGSQFLKPTEGNVFVVCEFTIENNSGSEMAVSSLMSFECYFDDYAASISIGAMTADQSKRQLDGTVAPGKKISGVVGYEAPSDWSEMEVHFKTNLYANPFVFNYSK